MADLLNAIRTHYVRQLAQAVSAAPGQVEPVFRNVDGTLSLQGALQLPCRADWIPMSSREPQSVDADSRLTFDPIEFHYLSCTILVEPFTWDWATLIAQGITVADMSPIVGEWFYRWFDPEDTNSPDADGLFGVLHFASDPVGREGAIETTLDLGSAPVEVLPQFLKMVAQQGATHIRVL